MPIRIAIARGGIDTVLGPEETVEAVAAGVRRVLPTAGLSAFPGAEIPQGVDLVIVASNGTLPDAVVQRAELDAVPLALLAWELEGASDRADVRVGIHHAPMSGQPGRDEAVRRLSCAAESLLRLIGAGMRVAGGQR